MTEPKAPYVDLLRSIAETINTHRLANMPHIDPWGVRWLTADTSTEIAAVMRAFPGKWAKNDPAASNYHSNYAIFTTEIMGWPLEIIANRSGVCTRKVVGTREVTKTVPVTTEEVTVTEDIVEWECHSVLASAAA